MKVACLVDLNSLDAQAYRKHLAARKEMLLTFKRSYTLFTTISRVFIL